MRITKLNAAQKYRVKQWLIIQRAHDQGRLATDEEICCADDLISDEDLKGMTFDTADFSRGLYEPQRGGTI